VLHCVSRLRCYRKITSLNDQSVPVIGGDHITAGNLPSVSGVTAEENTEPGTAGWCTSNITIASLPKTQQAFSEYFGRV
jgi:hypothetical protein